MLKQILLSALCAFSTLTFAQIKLDLGMTITTSENQFNTHGDIVIEENEVTSIQFNNIDALIMNIIVEADDENALIIKTQFFEKKEDGEVAAVTDWLTARVFPNEPATLTITEEDNNGSLILTITPSIVK